MATKRTTELKDMGTEDLKSKISEMSQELSKMSFDHAIKGLANPLVIRDQRREIARLKTEERAREISAMSKEEIAGRSRIRARRK